MALPMPSHGPTRGEVLSAMIGDLKEEFSALARVRGLSAARLWYWKQVLSSAPRFALEPFIDRPAKMIGIGLGAILLRTVMTVALVIGGIQWLPHAIFRPLVVGPIIEVASLLFVGWLIARFSNLPV